MVTTRSQTTDTSNHARRIIFTYAFILAMGGLMLAALLHAYGEGKLALTSSPPPTPPLWLLAFRVVALLTVFGTDVYLFVTEPFQMDGTTRFGKIVKNKSIGGVARFGTFTVWAWQLQLLYFSTMMAQTVAPAAVQASLPSWLPTFTQLAFEVSAPLSLFITLIVTHVLYPLAVKRGSDSSFLFKPGALLMHNANFVFMIVELFAPGAFAMVPWHQTVTGLFALAYAVFANVNERYGIGIFFYPFLCPSAKMAIPAHAGLVIVLIVSGMCLAMLQHVYLNVHALGALALTVVLSSQIIMLRPYLARKEKSR